MATVFTKQKIMPIVAENLPVPVEKALADLCRDFYSVSGKMPAVFAMPDSKNALYLGISPGKAFLGVTVPDEPEAFAIEIDEEKIVLVGADALGAVYAIYTFSERFLGVDPMVRFSGIQPEKKEELILPPQSVREGQKEVRFRGWFLNDEDLLTDWQKGNGTRRIRYAHYANVMAPAVLDRVLETALRCGMNLVIPSSFIDIRNPAEEELVKTAVERGLYITQHHVEPLGVSHFALENFKEDTGEAGEISYLSNPAFYEKVWRYYIRRWSRYGEQVIWQLGLRGKADVPVWATDTSIPNTAEAHGKLISDAIARQAEILREELKKPFLSTATLWLEGAELYDAGHLVLPEGTIVVFSDVGIDQMFSADFANTRRREGVRYGIYYHVAYWGQGPHLAEGNDPEKMAFSYRAAREKKSLYYSILNVSNLRPVQTAAWLNSRILHDGEDFDLDRALTSRFALLFGKAGERVKEGYRRYFHAMASFSEERLEEDMKRYNHYYQPAGDLPFIRFAGCDGTLLYMGRSPYRKPGRTTPRLPIPPDMEEALRESEEKLQSLCCYWEEVEPEIPVSSLAFYRTQFVFQTRYLLHLTRWVLGICAMQKLPAGEERSAASAAPIAELEAIAVERRELEKGDFENWFRGDTKIKLLSRIEETRLFATGEID